MTRSKSPLWLSGALLLLTYVAFGWMAANWKISASTQVVRWFILVAVSLIVDIMATNPSRLLNIFLYGILGADLRSLFLVMGFSTLLVVILAWLPVFSYIFLAFCVALFFSLDLHERSVNSVQNFSLLLFCQICGLGLGFGGNVLWGRVVQSWPHIPLVT